ncbi:MAG: sulfotransferase family protein [Candidatus Scalindua sp.]
MAGISKIMKLESPVFIVGAPRSGTTLLYRILQMHLSFKPRKCKDSTGVNLRESKVFDNPYSTYSGYNEPALAYMLHDVGCYRKFQESTKWIQRYQRLLIGKNIYQIVTNKLFKNIAVNLNLLRGLIWSIALNDILIRMFFYYAKQARGMKRTLEKTPANIYYLPEIKATFPRAKLLFIYRHPVDVFSSYKRRLKVSSEIGIDQSQLVWLKISPLKFCKLYSKNINTALSDHASNPYGFMLIKYENLVSNIQMTLQHVYDFLAEPYEEECIPKAKDQNNEDIVDPHIFSEIKNTTKKWEDYISEVDARFIEDRLSKIMDKLEYSRYT